MEWKISRHNTLPKKDEYFWQVELLPGINILKTDYGVFINVYWLFWSVEFSKANWDKYEDDYNKEVSDKDY